MTQENKEFLLKDLCARIPYNVVGKCEIDASYNTSFDTIFQTHKFNAVLYGIKEDLLLVTPLIEDNDEQTYAEEEVANGVSILDFTPYLFPLSSMTEEQKKKWFYTLSSDYNITYDTADWCNKNHFDYRGLIEKEIAIDATGLNIY